LRPKKKWQSGSEEIKENKVKWAYEDAHLDSGLRTSALEHDIEALGRTERRKCRHSTFPCPSEGLISDLRWVGM